ncbi:hypothetical protein [Acidovorax sp. SUPP2539]|uniref:hypothetical protein n=1 Tax=Acidovorax sp. SUPP2539 TaxID=2920878 RepID=UPI0023DE49B8|nr:hypothetical protein [Acidovorax sp. SUPP2539]GKS91323.1 hypothetical protein AVTE2539_18180 [Acidovorax sp. SUPP2539]
MHTMRMRATVFMAAFVAACSPVAEVTPRHYVGLVVGHSSPLKIEIAKALIASPGKPVPQAGPLQLPPPSGLAPMKFDFGWVTAGGAIMIQSTKFAVIVLQEPMLDQGKVTWSCIVHPVEAKPNLCGSDYQNGLLQNK